MRICLIASSQFPIAEPFAGGLEAHTHALARTLKSRGHEVTLFAAAGSDPALEAEAIHPQSLQLTDQARRDISAAPESWMQQHHAYLGLMLQLAGACQFDVVHNNSLHHLPVAMSQLLDAPLVTTLHTPPTPWLESAMHYAGHAARFVAVSRATAGAWSYTAEFSAPVQVITNGVDTCRWRPGPGGNDAVWIGRIAPEKAPHLAIEAARAAGIRLQLAGPVMDAAYFAERVQPLLGPAAVYRGHLCHQQLVEVVGASAVAVVSPIWDEPYGLVAAEAMSCGTPVAATPRGGLIELIGPASGALAADDSPAALAEAIRTALRCDRMRVRQWAQRHLSLTRMVDEYEELYARLARNPKQRSPTA
ncbi:glycosyltransferase [Nesterenkonia alba]|uniref:glycosyltransferase n=1 Tax=Nesterenkonia alba TaxID=515814 RepID=UPI0003B6E4EE|nr:glycosyltransferase [Nesterenkonia alba]